MGSVTEERECNICGGVVFEDYYWKTNEFTKTCMRCGYHNSEFMKRDDKGLLILDENENPIWEKEKINNPCGCYCLALKDEKGKTTGISQYGSLGSNLKEEDVLKQFDLNEELVDAKKSYITFRNPETGEIKILFGEKKPELFKDLHEESDTKDDSDKKL